MVIRPSEKKDLLVCEKLLHLPDFRFADGKYPDVEFLEKYLDDDYFLVVEIDEKIIGCIFGEPIKANGVFIWYFVVEEKHRNKGIGTKLFSEFEKRSRKNGIKWFNLYANSNKKTINFYSKNGLYIGKPYIECKKILE